MEKYLDRSHAGKVLAEELKKYANNKDVLILALPRGGVPVAYEVAKKLALPLDVFIVRKLGVPGHEELAMGAIAPNGAHVFNEDIISQLHIPSYLIDEALRSEQQELKRRELAYRGKKPFPELKDKIIILIDDGIATGATIRAAIKAIKQQHVKKIILAIPVAAFSTIQELAPWVDEIICPLKPANFYAVGAWYVVFGQTSDEEVVQLLQEYSPFSHLWEKGRG